MKWYLVFFTSLILITLRYWRQPKICCFIVRLHQSTVRSGTLAYSAIGNSAMICQPVAGQNIGDWSAEPGFTIRVATIVQYHALARQHIKYGIGALTLFVHGDD